MELSASCVALLVDHSHLSARWRRVSALSLHGEGTLQELRDMVLVRAGHAVIDRSPAIGNWCLYPGITCPAVVGPMAGVR
jgi:hypothetical protein